jgi:hypothetical protein
MQRRTGKTWNKSQVSAYISTEHNMTLYKNSTFAATIIATVVATGAWSFGLCERMWPAHPFFADLLICVVTLFVVKQIWIREFPR